MSEEARHAARAKMAKRAHSTHVEGDSALHASLVTLLGEVKDHITAGDEDADAQTKLDQAIAALS